MTTLGIGKRVWIRWSPEFVDSKVMCNTGTVTGGPFPPGHVFEDPRDGHQFMFYEDVWSVQVDNNGGAESAIKESHLTPIDDGETEADRARGMAVET